MKLLRNTFITIFSFIYLLLEYLFWNTLLEPIYLKLKELNLYKKLLELINNQNKYVILSIFILFFVVSEVLGLLAFVVLSKGMVGIFIALYLIKFIPVAIAFTILENGKDKLLTIRWFAFIYHYSMKILHILRNNILFLKSKKIFEQVQDVIKRIVAVVNNKAKS